MRKGTIKAPVIQGDTPEQRIEAFKKANLTFFWEPYLWQSKALGVLREKNITAIISSNKLGKTAFDMNVAISWCLGYDPWTKMAPDDPMAVCEYGKYYRKSSLGIPPPVNIVITGEDWKTHIGLTLVPELKKWAPAGWYETKKNEQGVEYIWDWINKSRITIMCYSQDDSLFESFRVQGVIMDEPPPQSKYSAMSRGLLLDCGKILMSLTPLKEAWILDEIVLSGRRDIGVVDGLCITDNPDLLKSDMQILDEIGLSEEQKRKFFRLMLYEDFKKRTPVSDRGYSAEKFLEAIICGH